MLLNKHFRGLFLGPLLALALGAAAKERAPAFRLEDTDGKVFDLQASLGHEVVLLDFWATFCLPCLAELNTFKDLESRYREKGFRVLAISVDQPQTLARVRAFTRARAFPFPMLVDPGQEAYRLYAVSALPTSLLIDRNGFIAYRQEGFQPGEEKKIDERIQELLGHDSETTVAGAIVTAPTSPTQTPSALTPTTAQPTANPPTAAPASAPFSGVSLSGSNFLRANYGREQRSQPDPNGWFEDWFDLRATDGRLAYQLRYRAYQFLRDLPGTGDELIRDPTHRIVGQNLSFNGENAVIQAGNIYGNVGRGLLFRFFEDRTARIDKDLNGFRAALQVGQNGSANSEWGRGRVSVFGGKTFSRYPDIHTVDAEEDAFRDLYLQGLEAAWDPRPWLKAGAQYAEAFRDGWNVRMAGGNGEYVAGPTDLYLGYMGVTGEDKFNFPHAYDGRALYGSLTENLGRFEAGAEYKYYYDYDLAFTDPPSLVQYHTFRLMARDMLFPNNQDEQGVQVHGAWHFRDQGFYAANVSRILSHPERNPTLLIHHVELPYLDWDNHLRLPWHSSGSALLDVDWNTQRKFSESSFEDIRALSLGMTAEKPVGAWVIGSEGELQYRNVDFRPLLPGDPAAGKLGAVGEVASTLSAWQGVVSATLGRASRWSLTLDYEATTSGLEEDRDSPAFAIGDLRNGWGSAYFNFSLPEGHAISLWAGQRKERVVCAGGSCRIEPAFEGTELVWTSHF